jgi:hypothetical protein
MDPTGDQRIRSTERSQHRPQRGRPVQRPHARRRPDRAIDVGSAVIAHGRQLTSRRIHDPIRNLARDIPADTGHSGLADFRHQIGQVAAT